MKLVDLEQRIFVPVVDEIHGGMTIEMQMTVGEFFARCCQGFEPEVVEAIPVVWMEKWKHEPALQQTIHNILFIWNKEQEAR